MGRERRQRALDDDGITMGVSGPRVLLLPLPLFQYPPLSAVFPVEARRVRPVRQDIESATRGAAAAPDRPRFVTKDTRPDRQPQQPLLEAPSRQSRAVNVSPTHPLAARRHSSVVGFRQARSLSPCEDAAKVTVVT